MLTALVKRPGRQIYFSISLHRAGEGLLEDLDWITATAYAESKLYAVTMAAALARRWPDIISNAVDPGWVRTRMDRSPAPVDLHTGQRIQSSLAVSDDPQAMTTSGYWHDRQRQEPAPEITDPMFQDRLIAGIHDLTAIKLSYR